jgi:uncharacterized coiled-coil protein SlyX
MSTPDERITELEIRVAYQEKLIATLDEVVRAFTARVERLERREKAEVEPPPSVDEPPPHY